MVTTTFRTTTSTDVHVQKSLATATLLDTPNLASWGATFVIQLLSPAQLVPPWPSLRDFPEWQDQEYRQAYLSASVEQGIAWQIRANRKGRNWSQDDLAQHLGTQQSAVSRLEDSTYGAYSLDTLVCLANVFDCALSVRFVPYSVLAAETENLSPEAMFAAPFTSELLFLESTNGNQIAGA